MNNMRKVFFFSMAMMLAAFALPGIAQQSQNKTFTLNVSVLSQGMGTAPTQLQAVLTNTSPKQSSSTFSAVDLFVNLNWTIKTDDPTNYPITAVESGSSSIPNIDATTQGHIKVSNLYPVKPGETLTVTFWVIASSCGDATWYANTWSGALIGTGNIFTQNPPSVTLTPVACGDLACGEAPTPPAPSPGQVAVVRNDINKDGTFNGCQAVNYYVSDTFSNNTGLPTSIVHFRWLDSAPGQTFSTAAFLYTVYYASQPSAPKVGWLYQNGTFAVNAGADPNADPSNPVVLIAAPLCASPTLPQLHGILNSAINSPADTTIKVDTSTGVPTPPTPFAIEVGTERMQVLAIQSGTWTVQRGQGGTTAAKHSKYDPVASNPLPLLPGISPADGITPLPPPPPPYTSGKQAQMCVSSTGTESGIPFIKYIDIGDGWSSP